MRRSITFSQSIQLWWRFALTFIGVLLASSLVTHLSLWLAASLTQWLYAPDFLPASSFIEISQAGKIRSLFLHCVGLSSIAFFVFAQVVVFYGMINHHKKVREILYGKPTNPYAAPVHKATQKLLR